MPHHRSALATLRRALPLLFLTAAPCLAQEYQVQDLGAMGDTNQTWSINESGQVAGYARLSDGQGGIRTEGFFFDGTSITYIGTPPGTSRSDLLGVNDLGQAVGKAGTTHESGEALLRETDGRVLELGTLGGSRSAALAINDAGQVVGWTKLPGDSESRAFVWEQGVMQALPLLGGTQGQASWINDAGQIVGGSTSDTGGFTQYAVLWENGTVRRLPPVVDGLNNLAEYIHDDGTIAGRISVFEQDRVIRRAAIWRNREVDQVLGTLADGTPQEPFASSIAYSVNACGVIVGMSVDASGAYVPFVYRGGTMTALDDLLPDPWTTVFVGTGSLNDQGQIVVSATRPDDSLLHALLLTPPVPCEPLPRIASLTPDRGRSSGGNTVVIRGTGFTAEAAVSFGSQPGSVTFIDATELHVLVPAAGARSEATGNPRRLARPVAVTVTTPSGSDTEPSAYLYLDKR